MPNIQSKFTQEENISLLLFMDLWIADAIFQFSVVTQGSDYWITAVLE